ncbi:hypothetical protein NBO_4g0065 [Nosema bombycis CQ1]|uniref:Uncharacterized protein n=1 Tax=Nosema bombycis (strain CQ1 / CVCC 102059) TaxID=578461 RepID=R0KZ28_NOSB1|nr:hypothetical protein NBO_4g0065 [Nosema bombycis CQ1]|eukprot:EOB15437.1 hypothetical protein NBO_4g0065 [Nosema bombycis CQ1]
MLNFLNLFLNLLILKYEIDSIPFYKSQFILKSELRNINCIILDHLNSILRNDVVFVTKKGSESIFEPYCKYNYNMISKNEDKGESLFKASPLDIPSPSTSLHKHKIYFFLDSKFYISHFKDFDFVDFDSSLNYTNGKDTSKLFINLFYKLIKNNCVSSVLGDTEFDIKNYKNFKEVKLSNKNIGIIHKTIYEKQNYEKYENYDLFKEIQNHFINFYKNIKPNTIFLELSEKYIKSIIELIKNENKSKEGNKEYDSIDKENFDIDNVCIEDLFPFHFYKNITKTIEENTFITGGICLKNKKGEDLRFIMTGIVKKDKGMMYIEIV